MHTSVKAHSISSQINIKCQFATRAAFYDRFSGDDSARFTQASGKRSGYRVSCQRKRKKRLNIHRPKRVCNKIIQRVPFKIAEMFFKEQFKSQNELRKIGDYDLTRIILISLRELSARIISAKWGRFRRPSHFIFGGLKFRDGRDYV